MKCFIALILTFPLICFGGGYDSSGITITAGDARYVKQVGDGTIDGNLTVEGHIYEEPCRAVAFLTAPSNTVIATAGVFQAVSGVFSNTILQGWTTTTVDGDPAIVFTNSCEDYFEIQMVTELRASVVNTDVSIATKINGVVQEEGAMETRAFSVGAPYSLPYLGTAYITNGTTIQLVVTSDGGGDVITFDRFKTSIKRFR